MVPAGSLVALLGTGLAGAGAVRTVHRRRGPVATGLVVIGVVLLAASAAGVLASNVPRWVLLSAVLSTAGLAGVSGLCVGTMLDDARLATAGYWVGSSTFAVPVVLVGQDPLTVVAGTAATLLFAGSYAGLAERTPARTVTVGSNG